MAKPILVAEIGLNWDNLDQAKEMIELAKEADFDLAKFQLYDSKVIRACTDQDKRYKLLEHKLHPGQAGALFRHGRKHKIEVFFTCMYPDAVETVEAIGCRYVKIRCNDPQFAEIMGECNHGEFGGLVFYSTTNPNASIAVNRVPLYCVPAYPATVQQYEPVFNAGPLINRIGISLHAPDKELWLRSYKAGAVAIETHVRMDESTDVIDMAVSVPFGDVAEWIAEAKDGYCGLGGQLHYEPGVLRAVSADDLEPSKRSKLYWKNRRSRVRGRAKS